MHRNLLLNLLRAVYWYADAMQINMSAQGYPRMSRPVSFLLLNIVQGEDRAINIARNLGISRQAVSQMLTDLCNRGVLTMRENPDNRRSRIVEFSRAFADQGAACAEVMSKLEAEISRRVGSDDFKAMSRALEFRWGAPPKFARLSRAEFKHGQEVWHDEFETESVRDDSLPATARSGSELSAARRGQKSHRSAAIPKLRVSEARKSASPRKKKRRAG